MDKNDVTVVRTNSHCKQEVVGHVQQNNHVSITASLHFGILPTEKRVNHGGEYGLEIPANFHFYLPEKAIV